MFEPFPKLPAELRYQIWAFTLPEWRQGSFIYIYRSGCWKITLKNHDGKDNYDYAHDKKVYAAITFDHESLDSVQFDLNIFLVNKEAHDIVLDWIRNHPIRIVYRNETEQPLFLRPFQVLDDTLFVGAGQLREFLEEPTRELAAIGSRYLFLDYPYSAVRSIAVSETLFMKEGSIRIFEMIRTFLNLAVLTIISLSDLEEEISKNLLHDRLKYWSIDQGNENTVTLRWETENRAFRMRGTEYTFGEESMYNRLSKVISDELVDYLIQRGEVRMRKGISNQFEVRWAVIVRK